MSKELDKTKQIQRYRCDWCRTLIPLSVVPLRVRISGTAVDGDKEFCGNLCLSKFNEYHFQIPLPLAFRDPYGNTGVKNNYQGDI